MKRLGRIAGIFMFALAVCGGAIATGKTDKPKKETAVIEFTELVKLDGVLLRGEYLVVHDEERMARGEPCTAIYRGKVESAEKLVASFHCVHMDRTRVNGFTVRLSQAGPPYGLREVQEIQFAGSTVAHGVPNARG